MRFSRCNIGVKNPTRHFVPRRGSNLLFRGPGIGTAERAKVRDDPSAQFGVS
jgi:hypothetical protein